VENPIRVLLVEDNPLDVQLLRWMLLQDTHQTFELETADTLSAGIQKIQQGGVDLLLLDLSLPDAHGFDTFHRAVEAVPDLPIIMLTGLDDENLALNAMKAGAQDYLVKGAVDSRGLRKAIRYAVERKRLHEQIVAYSEELSLKNEQLASDLKIAREIQQAFLPQHYPSFPLSADPENSLLHFWHRYFPTGEVGGDFFSILELSDSKAGVIICDVMGHGVSAAHWWRSYSLRLASPDRFSTV
jgi:phosphoserine phosphatase RsbU/P